jgi:hypothetical protein
MQPTPRLRVLSNRNPRVLVIVYFCRGLSGNMEKRPTHRVYIEILTCEPIFYHLEESRSHRNEREAERARGLGARPPPLGARPGVSANQVESRGFCSTKGFDAKFSQVASSWNRVGTSCYLVGVACSRAGPTKWSVGAYLFLRDL